MTYEVQVYHVKELGDQESILLQVWRRKITLSTPSIPEKVPFRVLDFSRRIKKALSLQGFYACHGPGRVPPEKQAPAPESRSIALARAVDLRGDAPHVRGKPCSRARS